MCLAHLLELCGRLQEAEQLDCDREACRWQNLLVVIIMMMVVFIMMAW